MTVEISAKRAALPTWAWWTLALLAVLVLFYGAAGYAMTASLAGAHPESLAQARRVAIAYLCVMGVSLVGLVTAGVALWRRRRPVEA